MHDMLQELNVYLLLLANQFCFIFFFFFSGHGMIVEGHPDLEHWGRRLMASRSENDTESKNCSEPGTFLEF